MAKLLDGKILKALRTRVPNRKRMRLLLDHIDALQEQIDSGKVTVNVGAIKAEVDAGEDKVFGTDDDKVTLSKRKKAPAKKKSSAKKAK